MNVTARLSFLFLLVASCFLLVATFRPALAQTSDFSSGSAHVQKTMIDVMTAMTCQLVGVDPTGVDTNGMPKKCLGYNPQTGEFGMIEDGSGALGIMGGLIASLYHKPVSTTEYIAYVSGNFGIAKPAYAQEGVGFEGLRPLLAVWSVFRNVVYGSLAIAFIVIGVAIMLRIHIDPRTVMTIQNQIPRLIIALLLVTFSYAIAGFLVDLMYVSINLLFGTVASISGTGLAVTVTDFTDLNDRIYGKTPFEFFKGDGLFSIISDPAIAVSQLIGNLFKGPGGSFVGGLLSGVVGMAVGAAAGAPFFGIGAIPGALIGGALGVTGGTIVGPQLLGGIGGAIAFLIIAVAVLWSLFRLWFILITAYVMFLIDVVFAPFWISAGVFPGNPLGIGAWLRSMVSNLIVFPVTIAMFLLAVIFMKSFQSPTGAAGFAPPLIGNPGTHAQETLSSLIGLGFILLTPQVVAMAKEYLKAPVFKYTAAIGQAVGVGPGVVGSTFTAVASPYGALAMFKNLKKLKGDIAGLVGGAKEKLEDTTVKPPPAGGSPPG